MIDLNDTNLPRIPSKCRVTLLALGDVGSTLLMGLRLMGGDVIGSIGICDVRPGVSDRWEFELNQIQPPDGAALPPVDIIRPEQLFDGDVFLFCASRMIPDTSVTAGDVRMAQYGLNRELVSIYARMARDRRYRGLFCVVSDPVDPLCRAVLRESGLSPAQVRGFGLGVMHARALYYARRDPRFASYLTEGRAFGPHGEDLVLANSVAQLPNELMIGGQLLNIKFNPASFTSEQGIQNFLALLKGYFDKKGFQMQINVVDKATLLEAQHTPENYRDLMVRVAGYSAYFVSIDKDLQNDIIRRTEHNV